MHIFSRQSPSDEQTQKVSSEYLEIVSFINHGWSDVKQEMEEGDHFFTFYIFSENVVAPCWLLPFSSPHANFSTWTYITEMFKIAGNNLHKGPFHNQQLKCLPQVYFSLSNPPKN